VGTGTVIGLHYGGVYGAMAGSLFAGSGLNAARAFYYLTRDEPDARREAVVSGSYAIAISVLAGWLTHKAMKAQKRSRRAA
jgi:hypothetical protein